MRLLGLMVFPIVVVLPSLEFSKRCFLCFDCPGSLALTAGLFRVGMQAVKFRRFQAAYISKMDFLDANPSRPSIIIIVSTVHPWKGSMSSCG